METDKNTEKYKNSDSFGCYEGLITYFLCCNLPYISEGIKASPNSKHDDGMNDLLFVGNEKRYSIAKLLIQQDSGSHINNNFLHQKRTNE